MLKRFGFPEMIFSINSFVAAMLALYIAFYLDLPRPYWALLTVYLVAQPLSGALRSRAVYRLLGTLLAAVASVALVPNFVNSPLVLSVALAAWVGICLYISLLDRSPRPSTFQLAGFTAAIISFPTVDAPETIFDTALSPIEEISVAIVCATAIDDVVVAPPSNERQNCLWSLAELRRNLFPAAPAYVPLVATGQAA